MDLNVEEFQVQYSTGSSTVMMLTSISTEKIPADLQGLPIVYSGNSLLPHPEMARWVAARVESATVADR